MPFFSSIRLFLFSIPVFALVLGNAWRIEREKAVSQFPLFSSSVLEEQGNSYQEKSFLPQSLFSAAVVRESITVGKLIAAKVDGSEWSQRRIRDLSLYIVLKSRETGISPYLVLSLIEVESQFNPAAVSPKGAVGLMQLMPETARQMAQDMGVPHDHAYDLVDPRVNVALGINYILHLKKLYSSKQHILAAYNLGPAALQRRLKSGGPVPRAYYQKVMEAYKRLNPSRRGNYLWL